MLSSNSGEGIHKRYTDLDANFSILPEYKNYITVTANGVARLDEKTPESIEGVSTSYLKTCCAIIIYVPGENRVSFAHHFIHSTTHSSYEEEINWLDSKDPRKLKVIIAKNQRLLSSVPAHAPGALNDIAGVKAKLVECGVLAENITEIEANYGAVAFSRKTQECIAYDRELPDTALIGTPYPYITLRQKINYFAKAPNKLDLQYCAGNFTALPPFREGLFSLKNIREISNLGAAGDKAAASNYIKRLPQVQNLASNRTSFATPEEFNAWVNGHVEHAIGYEAAKELYAAETGPYNIFALDAEKRRLIIALGGKVLEATDQGMFVFEMPSRMLTKNVRDELAIERVRFRDITNLPVLLKRQLDNIAKGWVEEDDFHTNGATLITFPYHDLSERDAIKAKIEQAKRAVALINTSQEAGAAQEFYRR